ncbi:MAG: hypothetical protein WBQ89_28280, partial [Candidatus Acidiferrum sp.]
MKLLNISLGTVLLLCGTGLAAEKLAEIHGGGGILLPPPPPTAAKPVTETLYGVTITDPYRWLED